MMPIPHPRRRLGGGRCYLPGDVGWWGASPLLTRSLFGGGRVGQWWCWGFRTPRRWYVSVSGRRTSTPIATWLRWREGSIIPGRFFRDLTGAMILWWFLIFGCPPPVPVGCYSSSGISDAILVIIFDDVRTPRDDVFAYNYWMHANLNTTLFYDLVLLIECSYWKSSPSFTCARQFGVIMHTGMKGGVTYHHR